MIDESMDKTALNAPPQKWEFRSKNVWQRLLIISGGVLVNFILAFVLYSAVLSVWGKEYIPADNAIYGFDFPKTMLDAGFENGDKILKINGQSIQTQQEIFEHLLLDGNRDVTVERGNETMELRMPQDLPQKILEGGKFASIRFPFVIDSVSPNMRAANARLQKGDSIIAVNGRPMFLTQDITNEFFQNKNEPTNIIFVRNGFLCSTTIYPNSEGKIGVVQKMPSAFLKTNKEEYGFVQSIPAGFKYGIGTLVSYVKQFKLVFTKEGVKQLGGFGSIGGLFPSAWNWQAFWELTAFLSVILAFMNFLPIPGLDGGYALFLIYEAITGRKPSDKFMERATTVGFVLLVILLLYANGNDLFKWLSGLF
ncbi:MAG: RIP metalloprotease RseP [Paludibacter sp.]|nr:RIP metalloprotease RseP [Paludibacter sp.]